MAIKRIWHGWTTPENADAYYNLLLDVVFPQIEAKQIPGYMGIELLRRKHETEIEFITIITFQSLKNVIDFQGEDYTRAYIPDEARQVLKRWDEHASHYEALANKRYDHPDTP